MYYSERSSDLELGCTYGAPCGPKSIRAAIRRNHDALFELEGWRKQLAERYEHKEYILPRKIKFLMYANLMDDDIMWIYLRKYANVMKNGDLRFKAGFPTAREWAKQWALENPVENTKAERRRRLSLIKHMKRTGAERAKQGRTEEVEQSDGPVTIEDDRLNEDEVGGQDEAPTSSLASQANEGNSRSTNPPEFHPTLLDIRSPELLTRLLRHFSIGNLIRFWDAHYLTWLKLKRQVAHETKDEKYLRYLEEEHAQHIAFFAKKVTPDRADLLERILFQLESIIKNENDLAQLRAMETSIADTDLGLDDKEREELYEAFEQRDEFQLLMWLEGLSFGKLSQMWVHSCAMLRLQQENLSRLVGLSRLRELSFLTERLEDITRIEEFSDSSELVTACSTNFTIMGKAADALVLAERKEQLNWNGKRSLEQDLMSTNLPQNQSTMPNTNEAGPPTEDELITQFVEITFASLPAVRKRFTVMLLRC
jgi:hypothetical protein